MEETISMKEVIEVLRKHLKTIVIATFTGLVIAIITTFFILTPQFSSQAQLIVTLPQSNTTNANDVNTNLQMINTYKDMIVSDLVLNEVKERLETEDQIVMSAEEIKKAISVNQSQNSQMFSIQAISPNPDTAQQIANTTSNVFQTKAKDVMNVDKISIISEAVADGTPVSPNNKLNIAIGLVLGLIVGVGLSFLFELFDRTVKDEKFISEVLDLPILGTVSEMSDKDLNTNRDRKNSKNPKTIATNDKPRVSRRNRSKA